MTSHRIALITDSTCDLPQEMREEYEIEVIPLYVIWGDEELRDEIDITADGFYDRLQTDPVHPTTSQPTPKDFVDKVNELKAKGVEEAVIIVLSDKLSGTLDLAQQAQDLVDIPLHCFDSKSISMGLGWQVIAAAKAREAGGGPEEMLAAAEKARDSAMVMFTVDTLDYLHKGGRIGAAAKMLGTALQLKPQLVIDPANGVVEPGERVRTRSKAIDAVYSAFFSRMGAGQLYLTVMHVGAHAEAVALVDRVEREHNNVAYIFITSTSPVIGVHGGPGTLGLVGYTE